MKLPFTGLSDIQKLLIFLFLIFGVATADIYMFARKSDRVELYDDLTERISAMRISISKLEYLLDMFVVARRFESASIAVIEGDVNSLDERVTGLLDDPKFTSLLAANPPLSDGLSSVTEDLQKIKVEITRLNDALNRVEIILIHNAVDIQAALIIENTDRLLNTISESRQAVFDEIRGLELKSVAVFLLLMLMVSLVYFKRLVSPVDRAGAIARRVSSGNLESRFREDTWSLVGRLGGELNQMLETLAREREKLKALNSATNERLAAEGLKTRAFAELMSFAGSSLAHGPVLEKALSEAVSGAGADAGAAYIEEGGLLKLKASAGFGSEQARRLHQLPMHIQDGVREAAAPAFYSSVADYPDSSLGEFVGSCGFESLCRLPILYDDRPLGFLFVFYSKRVAEIAPVQPFLEAICYGAAVSIGHAGLFQDEHDSRRFVERLINQLPFGLAVFDKSGSCMVANATLKKMLGAGRTELVGEYSIFDDEVLASGGVMPTIKKAYEGYTTEFTINYDPAGIKKLSFRGPRKKLRIKSSPLYDAGGDISSIVLLYEDLSGQPGVESNSGDAL